MSTRFKGAVIFNFLFILVFAVAIVIAIGYNSRARLAPLVISIPGLAVTVGRLVVELKGKDEKKSKKDENQKDRDAETAEAQKRDSGTGEDREQDSGTAKEQERKDADTNMTEAGDSGTVSEVDKIKPAAKFSELNAFLWVGGLLVLLFVVGFLAAIPIYLFLYLKVRSQEKLVFTIIFSLVSWGALYFFFGMILHIPLYEGIIAETFF
ncbi:hypothetical protein JCM15765_34730 [Paradesulfitobacterium aromaticivorans]